MTEPALDGAPAGPALSRLVLVGLAGGLLSGTFGVGGGIVMVPLLLLVARLEDRRAAATSLAAIVPASLAGVVTYAVRGDVAVGVAVVVALGAMAGSTIGTRILRRVRVDVFRWLLAALLVAAAVQLFVSLPERDGSIALTWALAPALLALGLVTGILSGLFGIGGGIVIVPVLIAVFGASDLVAKGTSLLVIIPTAITGTVANARGGMVDVRSGLAVGVAAAVASALGASLAGLLSPRLSNVLFGVLLIAFAGQMVQRALRGRRR
ncbi:sulfite exporter TauE/SafE family protein [Actinotalea fermentans]|uniref:sulfite exporter TauE/SafE family protein n=1 Tax=Actinotalea fermentans TaxID=43671 RepID=UPI00051F35F1|nr:sulfite exporter TauE/SafE family protein [Actinotalea fermentans]KGM16538.1 hypothetical protein N867_18975 [Actinotalea fermentans ATCC 43279 = JCM 9966 = DSM 3133]